MTEPPLVDEGEPVYVKQGYEGGFNYYAYTETYTLMCDPKEAERADAQMVHNGFRKRIKSYLNANGVPLTLTKLIELTDRGWLL